MHHRTPLPANATFSKSLDIFRNHDTLIKLDPDLASYEKVDAWDTPVTYDDTKPEDTFYYKINDHMATLPKGLWDTTVSYQAAITNIPNGVRWVIRAPLGIVQRSNWTVEPATTEDLSPENQDAGMNGVQNDGEGVATDVGATGRLVLVEDVNIKCSTFLIGTVKAKCEEQWPNVHKKWLEHLEEVEKLKD